MDGKRRKVRVHERAAPFRLHGGRLSGLIAILLLTACQSDSGTAPTSPSGITFSAVAASGHASCGLTTDGVVYCWGDVALGIHLVGTSVSNTPVRFDRQGAHRFTTLSVGGMHICGLTAEGAAFCWGDNTAGQLGDGTNTSSYAPVAVVGGHTFRMLSAGGVHTCGLTLAGSVYCWGAHPGDGVPGYHKNSAPASIVGGRTYITVSAGEQHACATATTGDVYCWGDNQSGQLGDGTSSYIERTTPVRALGGVAFASVSSGGLHTCALTSDGTAYCWGNNTFGRVGSGLPITALTPQQVATNVRFSSIVAGAQHTCAIALSGGAYCWGYNIQGQGGTGTTNSDIVAPTAVSGNRAMKSLALGHNHTCGVAVDGIPYCWGFNEFGQLGDGTTTNRRQPSPVVRP
jgi:alpha-tubulin suppressor-like RCC1 family protein